MVEKCYLVNWIRSPSPIHKKTNKCFIKFTIKILVIIIITMLNKEALAVPRYASRIVETKSGQIRGILQELNGRLDPVEVFRGIPYASPPIGDLRLRPPIDPIPWSGVKLADTFGPVCPQKLPDINNRTIALLEMPLGRYLHLQKMIIHLGNQSEDCLTLNIYIPGSGSRGLEAPYAVIVYIHGESFEWGSGNIYDGSVLASAGHVVVLTINYRLGILGFLRTRPVADNDNNSGGNLALKDITMALQWIKENIRAFGGDPNRVTIMGHDTGAALVNLVLLAPYAKGLIHRVVLLSGSALSPWASVHDPNNLRKNVGQQLGCLTNDNNNNNNDSDIGDCLRLLPLETLLNVELPEIKFMPRIGPSLPVDENNPDPGMDMERVSDEFIKVPLMIGVSTAESCFDFSENDIQNGFEEDQRNRILRTYIRNSYYYHLNEIFSAVRNEYTDWEKPILHPINIRESTMEALSDGHTVAPLIRIAYYHARRGAETYFFHFNYQTKDSIYPQRLGSVRGEDIPYVFGLPITSGGTFFPFNYTRQDQGVAEALLTFFTNFAKTGNPNAPHNIESVDYGTVKEKTRFRGINWDQYETGSQSYLTIALKPRIKSHYRGHKIAVWLNLIPQLHQPGDEDVSMRHHHFRERGDHLYAGSIRDEWHTPVPLIAITHSTSLSTSCTTLYNDDNPTEDITSILNNSEDDAELLQRLASRHYYSTTTALAITVGIGCILLVLNMLIFAGIYYQRIRDKKRFNHNCTINNQEPIPLTTLTSIRNNNDSSNQEPPPCYTTLSRTPSSIIIKNLQCHNTMTNLNSEHIINNDNNKINTLQKDIKPPKPPVRTTSSLTTTATTGGCGGGGGIIKKRIQMEEIDV